jgi:CRISPR/Cas system CMR-associated protein Cmr5 small subunit
MNLDQLRAQSSFSFVERLRPAERSKFLGLSRSLPAMLQTNGLLATWAHLLARAGPAPAANEYRRATEALLEHLRHPDTGPLLRESGEAAAVLTTVWARRPSGASGRELRRLTAEAIRYSVWLKRAAEALCEKESPEDRSEVPA